jgi:hypothetical protein
LRSIPGAREPISAVTSRKRRVMMEDVSVSNVRERWPGWWEGGIYPSFVVEGRCIKIAVRYKCRWIYKKKRDEEAKKKQRLGLRKRDTL